MVETVFMDEWAYVLGVGMLMLLWTAFFVMRADLRKRMLGLSLGLMPLAPLGQYFFLQDYWQPPVLFPLPGLGFRVGGLFDLMFSFAMAGIAGASYYVLSHKRIEKKRYATRYQFVGLFSLIGASIIVLLINLIHVNSIFSSGIAFLAVAILCLSLRRDLLKVALISGLICGIVLPGAEFVLSFIVPEYLNRYWLLYGTSFGWLILDRVPVTEAIWGALFGITIGVLLDTATGSAPEQVNSGSRESRSRAVSELHNQVMSNHV
jgi:hypothetical protein